MLVQLSPWQTVKTSLATTKLKCGRRRSDSQSSDSHHHHGEPSVVASIVPPVKRSSKRRKGQSALRLTEDIVPSIAITSAHRISVLGRMSKSRPDEDQEASAPQYQESTQWQYSSRPGRTTSFLQESLVNGNSKKHHHPSVPAVMDAKNNWVYALQHDNGTLCCWDATRASGPDDSDSSHVTKIKLKTPALSLSLHTFKTGIVYGTCVDGSVFLARWIFNNQGRPETFQVSYHKGFLSRGDHHVFTTGLATMGINRNAGQKRKANEGDHTTVSIHQIFLSDGGRIRLLKHELCLPPDNGNPAAGNTHAVQEVLIDIVNSTQETTAGPPIDVKSTIACAMDDNTVALIYHSRRRDSSWNCSCVHVCLETGRLIRAPFVLPLTARHASALSSSILVVGTSDQILFCDIMHGAIVHSLRLSQAISGGEWYLATDKKTRRIVVISHEGDHIKASMATVNLDATTPRNPNERVPNTLATELRSSLATTIGSGLKRADIAMRNLLDIDAEHGVNKANHDLDDAIDHALGHLKECRRQILDPATAHLEPQFFLIAYERALGTVLTAADKSRAAALETKNPKKQVSPRMVLADNPQDAIPSSKERDPRSSKDDIATPDLESDQESARRENGGWDGKLVNGIKTNTNMGWFGTVRAYTPFLTPQRFIDGATPIVLSTLQLPRVDDRSIGQRVRSARLDARLVLSRLIQSRKVSARLHFESKSGSKNYFLSVLRATKMSKKRGRVFSPVDLMHNMLTYCTDISERLMVTMLHYMFCRALPEDAAENLIESGGLGVSDRTIGKRFFNARTRLFRTLALNKTKGQSSSAQQIKELQVEVDQLSNKVLKAGGAFLVSRFATYSRCNETLLRSALRDGLSLKHEPALLAYILADLLSVAGRDATFVRDIRYNKLQTSCPSITQWITALCDTYSDRLLELQAVETGSEPMKESPIEYVRRAISAAVKQTEAVMSLRDAYEHSAEEIYSQSLHGSERKVPELSEPVDEEKEDAAAIPPYTLEPLVF